MSVVSQIVHQSTSWSDSTKQPHAKSKGEVGGSGLPALVAISSKLFTHLSSFTRLMHGMSERSYSSISNHKEGESRPLVGPDNAASVQENAQVRGTILHDCRRPSYQQDTNLKRPLDTGSSVTNDVSNSSSHSSLSLQYPHTEMVDPPPIPKNTPRTDNSSNGRKRIGESISTTRAPASSLSRTNEGRISYSAPKKNPKSFRSHLSYTMTSGDDSFDENSQESLPDYLLKNLEEQLIMLMIKILIMIIGKVG